MTDELKKSREMVVTGEVLMPEHLLLRLPSAATEMATRRFSWLSNEEIASILINFKKHNEWITNSRVCRPENGRLLMYNRKIVRYRQDMYTWKTKKKSKWPREDHVKLKVDGIPCITALYVHSDILPTFHRRCYCFIQNPDVILVHYLNQPYLDDGNRVACDLALNRRCQQWQDLAKEDVVEQLRPMFADMPWPRSDSPSLTPEQVDAVVNKLADDHYGNFSNPPQTQRRIGKRVLRAIEPKIMVTVNANPSVSSNFAVSKTKSGAALPSNITTYQFVANGCVPQEKSPTPVARQLQLPVSASELSGSTTYIVVPSPSVSDCSYVQQNGYQAEHVSVQHTEPEKSPLAAGLPVLAANESVSGFIESDQPAVGSADHVAATASDDRRAAGVKPTAEAVTILPRTRSTPANSFAVLERLPAAPPCHNTNVMDFLKYEDEAMSQKTLLVNGVYSMDPSDCAKADMNDSSPIRDLRLALASTTVPSLSAAGLHSESDDRNLYSSSADYSVALKDLPTGYGVKDAMVPNCRDDLLQPIPSPFSDKPCPPSISPELNLDVFDVESLFNISTPSVSTSIDSVSPGHADKANSSTESAVSDLFTQRLWDSGITASSSSLSSEQSNVEVRMQHATDCSTSSINRAIDILPDESLDTITDYSPDWSYTEGGVKVLLTGTWNHPGNYRCVFGDISVPTTNLQAGVLRCYCPAHKPGHVNLHITCDGRVVSRPVPFEYKSIPMPYCGLNTRWLQLNENEFKMSILERLERMEERLNSISRTKNPSTRHENAPNGLQYGMHVLQLDAPSGSFAATSRVRSTCDFEERLIRLCCKINDACRSSQQPELKEADGEGLTVLHYSAALGYNKLVNAMHSLRLQSDNVFLQSECDPQNVDKFDCTPLMWASACGQLDCAESLYNWSASELRSLDVLGRSPAAVAQQRGHTRIYNRLEELGESNGSGLRDVDDDVDTSSIGDTTLSGTLDTLDSGEDSMETDDTFSSDCLPSTPYFPTFFRIDAAGTSQSGRDDSLDFVDELTSGLNGGSSSGLQTCDALLENRDCVTSLAEKVVQCAPHYVKGRYQNYAVCSGSPLDEAGLTLRNLPQFVNSHCATSYYGNSESNQQCSELSSMLDWSDFLRQPPRKTAPSDVYRNAVELQLDSLRLTEHEYCQLFMAANTILNAYHCEGLALNSEVLRAYLLIQRCYAKYEKFALSKKMNEAAVLIQSKFRSYQEQKRFQRSRHAAILIQSFYRSYKYARGCNPGSTRSSKHTVKLIEDALRGHMTKRKQHQAARKIQRFLRRCQIRLRQQDLGAEADSISSRMKGFYAC